MRRGEGICVVVHSGKKKGEGGGGKVNGWV